MLIAEDLLLLLTDDETGKLSVSTTEIDIALGGANLVELTLAGRVDVAGPDEMVKEGRVVVRDGSSTGDPVLDAALAYLRDHEGKKPESVVTPLSKKLRRELYDRLGQKGVLRHSEGRILGIFPSHRWPAKDSAHERSVRERITGALVQGVTPDERTAALISLLNALKAVHKVVDPRQHAVRKADLNARAKEIAEGSWGSAAVRKAIEAMMAGIMVATIAAATAASAAGS